MEKFVSKINLNTVEQFLQYEDEEGFNTFEKNKKNKKFDDGTSRKKNNKKTRNKNYNNR